MKLALTSDTHYGVSKNTHKIHDKWLDRLYQEIKDNDVKALIHSGDWIAWKQKSLIQTLRMFRNKLPGVPILTVRGNHCIWDYQSNPKVRKIGWNTMQQLHAEWFKQYDIVHLENNHVVIDDVIITGFDGWYGAPNPNTNDEKHMERYPEGNWCHHFHAHRAMKALDHVLNLDIKPYRSAVCVTHHPPYTKYAYDGHGANPRYFDFIKDHGYKVLCTGHSHEFLDATVDGCRILNCGPDYDKPTHLIFDV